MDERARVAGKSRYGVLTLSELRDLKIGRERTRWLVKKGELMKVQRGLFVCAWLPGSWEQRATLALTLLGEEAALSHRTAASFHQLDGLKARPQTIEVLVRRGRVAGTRIANMPDGVVVHRTREAFETVDFDGFRVVEVQRTLVDLAGTLSSSSLDDALDSAMRRGTPGLDGELERGALKRRRGKQGARRLLSLIEDRAGLHTDSPLESRVFRRLRTRKLPRPRHQVELRDARGFIMRADFAWVPQKVALHVDGWAFHRQRDQFEHDRQKVTRLAAMGWLSLWVTAKTANARDWLDALEKALKARDPQARLPL